MSGDKYRPEFCKMLIDHMGMSKSYDSFPAIVYKKYKIYVGLSTMYDWEKRFPEWAEAKAIAIASSLDFMESRAMAKMSGQAIAGIDAKNIDSYVLMGMLKTRFYKIYGDKQTIEHGVSEGSITIEEFLKENQKKVSSLSAIKKESQNGKKRK